MNLQEVENRILWEQYFSPTFTWDKCDYSNMPIYNEAFVEEFKDKFDWCQLCTKVKLNLDFISKYKDNVNWSSICKYQELNENFIREFKDYVDWKMISSYQILSYDFMWEFRYNINWSNIINCRKLKNEFLDKIIQCEEIIIKYFYIDCFNDFWGAIATRQTLQEWFIEKYKHEFNMYQILANQKLSEKFLKQLLTDKTLNIFIKSAATIIKQNMKLKLSKKFLDWLDDELCK